MSKDHKRKAVPLPPARVLIQHGQLFVIVPDVVGKNAGHVGGREGFRHISRATVRYRESVIAGFRTAVVAGHGSAPDYFARLVAQAHRGAWRLEVLGVWPTERHTIKGHPVARTTPCGDCDAPIAQALDALQQAGILDDDARVDEIVAWRAHVPGQRWTIIRLSDLEATRRVNRDDLVAMIPEEHPCPPPARTSRPRKTTSR